MKRLALAVVLVACGGGRGGDTTAAPAPGVIVVPPRAPTAGDPMLAYLPAGADIVVELDLGRLRGNDVVGELAAKFLDDGSAERELDPLAAVGGSLPAGPLARADVVVLASYRAGTPEAVTIGLIVGGGLRAEELHGAADLGGGVIAVAPPAQQEELAAVSAGAADGLDDDLELRALRARGMPEGADGAVVRVTARLGFDARIALASQLAADTAPSLVSVWGDVADDVAVVGVLEAPDDDGAAKGAERASEPDLLALGLSPAIRRFQVETRGDRVKVVALVGPRRLSRVVARTKRFLDL